LFGWDADKAASNVRKHGVSFEEACEVLFWPACVISDAGTLHEERQAVIGFSKSFKLLYVVVTEIGDEVWRIVSARRATGRERREYDKETSLG